MLVNQTVWPSPLSPHPPTPTPQDVKLKDGRVIHYGAPGCTPTPPITSGFFTALPAPPNSGGGGGGGGVGGGRSARAATAGVKPTQPFAKSALSAYTTVAPSIKGGVGVPVGSDTWLANQVSGDVAPCKHDCN